MGGAMATAPDSPMIPPVGTDLFLARLRLG